MHPIYTVFSPYLRGALEYFRRPLFGDQPARCPYLVSLWEAGWATIVIMPLDRVSLPIVRHDQVADVECCGCLIVRVCGDRADITCNECGMVIRTVPATEAAGAMNTLMIEVVSSAMCTAFCPYCGTLDWFPGVSALEAFVCSECGEAVTAHPRVQ